MPKHYLPQAHYDACIADVASLFRGGRGKSLDELATQYGTKRAVVRRWLEEAGVRTKDGACIGLAEEELALALARRWSAGATIRTIVRETGLSEPRVSTLITSTGVDTTVHWERGQLAAEETANETVRDRFLAGQPTITITDLAVELRLRPSAVRRILEKAGVQSRRCMVGFNRADMVAALLTRRRFGISVQQLSVDTGIEVGQINAMLRSPDEVQTRRRREDLPMTSAQLVAAYRRGQSLSELAALVECSRGMVRNILVDAGVTLRPAHARPGPRRRPPTSTP